MRGSACRRSKLDSFDLRQECISNYQNAPGTPRCVFGIPRRGLVFAVRFARLALLTALVCFTTLAQVTAPSTVPPGIRRALIERTPTVAPSERYALPAAPLT